MEPFATSRTGRRNQPATGAFLLWLILASAAVAVSSSFPAQAAATVRPPSSGAGTPSGASDPSQAIHLTGQTPWVRPGGQFVLSLEVRSSEPRSALALSIKVYNRLTSRSELNSSLRNGPTGTPLDTIPPVPLAQLAHGAAGAVTVSMSVTAGQAPAGSISTAGASSIPLNLPCSSGPCSGVYPVGVSLISTPQGATLDTLGTYMIYDRMASTSIPLQLALMVPVVAPTTMTASGRPRVRDSVLKKISALVAGLSQHAGVPFGLIISAPLAQALEQSSDALARTTLSELRSLAAGKLLHPIADPSYAPVNVASIVGSGLAGQLAAQLSTGTSVLETSLRLRSPLASSVWASRTNLDPAAVAALRSLGISQLVLPAGNLAPTNSRLSLTQPFYLDTAGTTADLATVFDQQLTSLASKAQGMALGAYQVLAELAQIYFEQPNFHYRRAVVIDPPASWSPSSAFLHTLLGALATSPFVRPVTLPAMFSSVPVGAGGAPSMRGFSTPTHTSVQPLGHDATEALTGAFTTFTAFESALPTASSAATAAAGETARLEALLLIAEGRHLSVAERKRLLGFMLNDIRGELDRMRLTSAQITLTARTGRVPITITSGLPYAVKGRLSLETDKLIILRGPVEPVVISRHNTVFYFNVQARSAGDFPVTVALTSPEGRLTLLKGRLTVRSTAFSNLAIALSAAAVALLLAWWLRSSWQGRRHRRNATAHSPVPAQPGS